MKFVGPGLGNGVDEPASEASLTHVIRRDKHLVFAHRFDGNRVHVGLSPRDAARSEPEQVVVHAAIDLDVVEAVVLTSERRPRYPGRDHLRYRHDEIGEIAAQGRQAVDDRVRDECLRPGAGAGHKRAGLTGYGDGLQTYGRALDGHIDLEPLAQGEIEGVAARRLEAQRPGLQCVRAADGDVLEVVAPVLGRASGIALPGGRVHESEAGARHRRTRLVGDTPRHCRRGDTLRRHRAGGSKHENAGENADRPHETFHHDGSPNNRKNGVQGATKMPAAGRDVNSAQRHIRVTPHVEAHAAISDTRARRRE